MLCSFGGSHDHGHGHDHGDDIHSGHFCWDISKWGEIFYKEITIPVSDTKFEMGCKDVPKTVIVNNLSKYHNYMNERFLNIMILSNVWEDYFPNV